MLYTSWVASLKLPAGCQAYLWNAVHGNPIMAGSPQERQYRNQGSLCSYVKRLSNYFAGETMRNPNMFTHVWIYTW